MKRVSCWLVALVGWFIYQTSSWSSGAKPVRLNFVRQESASCSEMVQFPAFNKSAKLPEGETVPVESCPRNPANTSLPVKWECLEGSLSLNRRKSWRMSNQVRVDGYAPEAGLCF